MKRIRKIGFTNFILLISSLILVIILISFSFTKNAESASGIAQSWQVKNNIRQMASAIYNMESRKIAYVFTRQPKYKHGFNASFAEYEALRREMEGFVQHDEAQLQRLYLVDTMMNKHFTSFSDFLAIENTTPLEKIVKSEGEMLY